MLLLGQREGQGETTGRTEPGGCSVLEGIGMAWRGRGYRVDQKVLLLWPQMEPISATVVVCLLARQSSPSIRLFFPGELRLANQAYPRSTKLF